MNHILFTGATSGTGVAVAHRLCQKFGADQITCLVRPTSDITPLQKLGVRLEIGDVSDGASLARLLDADTVYLDMTHPKFYPQSLETIRRTKLERAFFVTTTGIFSRYHHCSDIYKDGEERIRACGLTTTILRPSMIYGSLRDKNMNRLIGALNRLPVFPLFGAGRALMQPVFVDDLADGIVAAVGNPATENRAFNLAGPVGLTYRRIVDTILKELDRRVTLLNVGLPLAAGIAGVGERLPGFPLKKEQVLRLMEDKVFDVSDARAVLDYNPRPFAEGIALEIAAMREAGAL